jgi:hypothetical protein
MSDRIAFTGTKVTPRGGDPRLREARGSRTFRNGEWLEVDPARS